ncbi:hypothetical protein GEMRC1_001482 [Eukaryota sp. GEM-RC1]
MEYVYDPHVLSQLREVIGCLNRCRIVLYLSERLKIDSSIFYHQINLIQENDIDVNVQRDLVTDLNPIDVGGRQPFLLNYSAADSNFKCCVNTECPNCGKFQVLDVLYKYLSTFSAAGKSLFSESEKNLKLRRQFWNMIQSPHTSTHVNSRHVPLLPLTCCPLLRNRLIQ